MFHETGRLIEVLLSWFAPCKAIKVSPGFRIPGTGFHSISVQLGFWIPSLLVFRILWAVFRIPKHSIPDYTSKILTNSEFHKQKVLGFRNPNSLGSEVDGLNSGLSHVNFTLKMTTAYRFLKLQSISTTLLFRTTITRMIIFQQLLSCWNMNIGTS